MELRDDYDEEYIETEGTLEGTEEEEDFGFYGMENEDNKVDDIRGITDEVTELTFTNMEYPCIVFKEGVSYKKHQWRILSNMVKAVAEDKDTALYFPDSTGLVKMGMLSGRQVESFLDLVGLDNVYAYYSKDLRLEGSKIYTLCVL